MKKLLVMIALFVAVVTTASAVTYSLADGKKKEKKENTVATQKKATVKEESPCSSKCAKAKDCSSKQKEECNKR